MATQVLFIQGAGSEGAYDEDAALAQSLGDALGPGYEVRYPRMPNEAEPDYKTWKAVIARETHGMGEGAILVGHSIGASVLIKMLTERGAKPAVAGIFLAAPPFWYDDDFWRWDDVALSADADQILPANLPFFIYRGDNDKTIPASHLDMYANALPQAVIRHLAGRDHQLNNDMSEIARDIEALSARGS